jgi:adenosine deaminase
LAEEMLAKHDDFRRFFAGFDLAGAEHAGSPVRFREVFLPLMEKCVHLTIHAGETVDVKSVWEAVYHLNADRIGHGLKLIENSDLMRKFRERDISVEMCPSSNNQIVGFNGDYPLKDYLDFGLKVTVNTDNPGISLTDFSEEYITADFLCGNSLNLWDVFQIIKNGFDSAFAEYDVKNRLITEAEKDIVRLIREVF